MSSQRLCFASVILATVTCAFGIKALADCSVEGCTNQGPQNVGCGLGGNGCTGTSESSCNADTGKTLGNGLFECSDAGFVLGECNCRNSAEEQDVCYTTFECDWDQFADPKCFKDVLSEEDEFNWIKTSSGCGA
jgi:hypothetical protein